jgi:hypothetical protein
VDEVAERSVRTRRVRTDPGSGLVKAKKRRHLDVGMAIAFRRPRVSPLADATTRRSHT